MVIAPVLEEFQEDGVLVLPLPLRARFGMADVIVAEQRQLEHPAHQLIGKQASFADITLDEELLQKPLSSGTPPSSTARC